MSGVTKERTPGRWSPAQLRKFQACLLDWYARNMRSLPWRTDPTPYHIWISEIMLQQTQVRTVLPYYERFMRRFPDIEMLADASENALCELWSGLGYYARARNLLRAARQIVNFSHGRLPETLEGLQALPGIGRYTAGAILSIAYNKPAPIVDGNVRRVISRLHALSVGVPESFFWRRASEWIPEQHASDFNQAVMELGAVVCVPASPGCRQCPVRSFCQARRLGMQDQIPEPRPGRAAEQIRMVILVVRCGEAILLARQEADGFIPGDWGLPWRALRNGNSAARIASNLARTVSGQHNALHACARVRHGITHRRIDAYVFRSVLAEYPEGRGRDGKLQWAAQSSMKQLIMSSLFRKAMRSAGIPVP